MSAPAPPVEDMIVELTRACDHDCLHCYNVWKNRAPYPPAPELGTAGLLELLGRVVEQEGLTHITLSGGEPLLRQDLPLLVDWLAARRLGITLVTNGRLLTAAAIERLGARRVGVWELPLLAVDRAVHDRLSGRAGAFDRATEAMADLKLAGATVVGVFVMTRLNLPQLSQVMELATALGLDGLMLNRFNPGGRGAEHVELLQSSPAELAAAFSVAERRSAALGLPLAVGVPVPPCLVDPAGLTRLDFGACSAGTAHAYYTLDPGGRLRPCNHSPTILGDLRLESFAALRAAPAMQAFRAARPALCAACRLADSCQGGCKAAAEVCCGSASAPDPFLAAFAAQRRRL
ncbi:MAG TPA: radical SAM protein [Myxococcota bacterium]|nr:radical SAM protein [Myxococcota bacterium]HRY95343.1 radical SAM protein [Myxococcota bacterium]HSA21186.1 radical SAM protein [Myxococcota bacterium]